MNRDPIQEDGGFNLYGYVYNSPVNYADYLGNVAFGWPVLPPPGGLPNFPVPETPDTEIRLCNRPIENPSNDCIIGCANLRGHNYYDWPDGNGGRDGVGFRDPIGRDGDLPQSEAGSVARRCWSCYRINSVLKYGSGAESGKTGLTASEEEIKDCLKNRPIKGDYHGLANNCNSWAAGAAGDCGIFCP